MRSEVHRISQAGRLKVLNPLLTETVGSFRLLREIKLAANLHHPHILQVYHSGDSAGFLWFSMPLVEGESLRARLKGGTPPAGR